MSIGWVNTLLGAVNQTQQQAHKAQSQNLTATQAAQAQANAAWQQTVYLNGHTSSGYVWPQTGGFQTQMPPFPEDTEFEVCLEERWSGQTRMTACVPTMPNHEESNKYKVESGVTQEGYVYGNIWNYLRNSIASTLLSRQINTILNNKIYDNSTIDSSTWISSGNTTNNITWTNTNTINGTSYTYTALDPNTSYNISSYIDNSSEDKYKELLHKYNEINSKNEELSKRQEEIRERLYKLDNIKEKYNAYIAAKAKLKAGSP